MDIKNEIVKAMGRPSLLKKSDGRTCLQIMVQSERYFRIAGGKRVKHTQYPMRCSGSQYWFNQITPKITEGTELLITGNLDQHYSKDSTPTTVIVINDMANLRILDRGAA